MAGLATADLDTAGLRHAEGRDSRWPLFGQGGPGDRAVPNAWQLMILYDLSGPDGSCRGASDDEVFGVLGRWGAAAGWLECRKLAVVRELIRRRPGERNAGAATDSGLPWEWDDRLAREIALELRVSVPAAQKLEWAAWALEARLPGIGEALDQGLIDASRARMVIEETDVLREPDELAAAEELILAGLGKCRTWMDLLRLVQRAVVTVDPDGAARRREQEEKENARVRFWRETAGTCALLGKGLPTDEALRAHANVEQRAQQYRAAGVKRGIEVLRVAAYLDLINGVPVADRVARFQAEDAAGNGDAAQPGAGSGTPNRGKPGAADPADAEPGRPEAGDADGYLAGVSGADGYPPDWPPGDEAPAEGPCGQDCAGGCGCRGPAPAGPGQGSRERAPAEAGGTSPGEVGGNGPGPEPGVAAEVNLTLRHIDIPFLTAAGQARWPGEARSMGVLDPALARRLAEAAARHPGSRFCLTITDQEGRAIGHGCGQPRKHREPRGPRKPSGPGKPRTPWEPREPRGQDRPGKGPPGGPAAPPSSGGTPAFTLTPGGDAGPPGGFGSWILRFPGQGRELTVDLHPVPTGECGHQYESARHDAGRLLRHLVNVRDGQCGFPACSRHARETDLEHARPFDHGGRTCGCNCWSASRSCHQVKQSAGWDVTEVRPGYHQWTTPSGRSYTQEPWEYPG